MATKTSAKTSAKTKAKTAAKSAGASKTLSLDELNRATLARQYLLAREKISLEKALDRLLAIQAQWPKPPFIAFWSRLQTLERGDLSALARSNVIVRGTIFRGTIFLMSAKDFARFRMTAQQTLERGVTSIVKGIPAAHFDRVIELGRSFFAEPHTFNELRDEIAARAKKLGLKTDTQDVRRMAYLVRMRVPLLQVSTKDEPWGWHAACDFTVADRLIDDALTPHEEKDALVLRYLGALGPATVADAQNFTGVTGLKEAFERLRPRLVTFRDDKNKELFDLPDAPRPDPKSSPVPPIRFLPDFDNVVMGYADRRRFVDDAHKKRVFLPGLVVARTYLDHTGRVGGTWAIDIAKNKKKDATLVVSPFAALDKKTKAAIEEEGDALLGFYEPEAGSRSVRFEKARA